MDPQRLLEALLELAKAAGVEVRSQALRGTHPSAGGLVRVNGREFVLLNSKANAVDRAAALADVLVRRNLDEAALSPDVKRFLALRARSEQGVMAPANPPRPGLAKTNAKKSPVKPQRRI
jgi:hypothetical protein